jgi:hypothetical protein
MAATEPPRIAAVLALVGHDRQTGRGWLTEWRPSSFDSQREFDEENLLNQLDLVEGDYSNYVELHEGYKIANWDWD